MKRPVGERVIVISGASTGIGRATARAAREHRAKVVVAGRNAEALANTVVEVEGCGGEALAVQGDATSESDAHDLCARAVERFGRIDTFVATVMVTVYAEVTELEAEELRRVLDVNFHGRVHCLPRRAAAPASEPRHVRRRQLRARLPRHSPPGGLLASKAAGRAFFESARVEQEKHGTASTSA